MMADFLLPDVIIYNILARLPAKPLLRCRCVSKHWNRLITDPYFMNKLRSRRIIILPLDHDTCLHIDHNNIPISIFKRGYPSGNLHPKSAVSRVIGTFNGIVLLTYSRTLILYNPFTGISKTLPQAPGSLLQEHYGYQAYGFGYGSNPDDLKIVLFRSELTDICDVYSLKDGSRSSLSKLKLNIRFQDADEVGTFLNGFLYWVAFDRNVLIVLNVKDMLLSEINVPFTTWYCTVLGTIDGCLSTVKRSNNQFEVWVMKDHGSWSIRCSFNLISLEATSLNNTCFYPLCVLDSGRIVMLKCTSKLPVKVVIYDTWNDSCVTFDTSLRDRDRNYYYYYYKMHGVEYVESLLSPSDLCSSMRLKKRKHQ